MKATEEFKRLIKEYLDNRAAEDTLFAADYAKPNKNIDECCNYILQEVYKSGQNGFADDEIFGLAVHYYNEDDLGAIKGASGKVVVNHHIELSEEEKNELKDKARAKFEADCLAEMKNRNKRIAEAQKKAAASSANTETQQPVQLSLFD